MRDLILWAIEKMFGAVEEADPFGPALCGRYEPGAMPWVNQWERIQYHCFQGTPEQQLHRFLDLVEIENAKAELARRRFMNDLMRRPS